MNSFFSAYKRDVFFIFLLVLTACLFRYIYYTSYFTSVPYALYPLNDAQMYWQWGLDLYRNGWMVPEKEAYYQAPLYPMFIAVLHHFGIHSIKEVIQIQLILGVINTVLSFIILRQYVSSSISLFFALCISLSPIVFFYETKIVATTLGLTLWLLFLLFITIWINSDRIIWNALFSVFLTLSIICRPNLLFFIPFLFLLFVRVKENDTGNQYFTLYKNVCLHNHFVFMFTILLFGISTVTIRNYVVSGEWVLLTGNSGVTLYMGNNPYSNGGLSVVSGLSNDIGEQVKGGVHLASELAGRELSLNESSRFWVKYTILYVLENPIDWTLLVFKKMLWSIYYLPPSVNYSISFESEFIRFLSYLSVLHILILSIGIVSIVSFRGFSSDKLMLIYCIFGYLLLTIIYYSSSRFLTPVIPVFAICAGMYMSHFTKYWKTYSKQIPLNILMIWMGLFFVINPFLHFIHDTEKATGWYNLGVAQESELFQFADSKLCYENALKWNPNHVSSLLNLGVEYAKGGNLIQSNELFHRVLSIDPTNQKARDNLEINSRRLQ